MAMEQEARLPTTSIGRFSSYERPLAILLTLFAILSPLYIDHRRIDEEREFGELNIGLGYVVLLVLVVVVAAVSVSCYLDQSFTRFDPYWIHRVGGSSGGIIVVLSVLVMVLKFKSSVRDF